MKKSIAAIRTMKAMEEINARLDLIEQMLLDTMSKAKREKYMPSIMDESALADSYAEGEKAVALIQEAIDKVHEGA